MSEFILIAPEGWTEMDLEWVQTNTPLSIAQINYLSQSLMYEIEAVFNEFGLFPEGKTNIEQIKVVDDAYLWVKFY